MATVAIGSAVGAPGATLSALAIAGVLSTWPDRRVVLVEANPDGGVLAVRYGLGRSPGLVELAAATRQSERPVSFDPFTQTLPGGLPVVVAPESPRQATSAISTGGTGLADLVNRMPEVDVVVDVGRMHGVSRLLAARADLTLMAVRPIAEHLYPARERLDGLRREGANGQWLLIGDGPYSPSDVAEAFPIPVAGAIPADARGVTLLEAGGSPQRLARSSLIRSVRSMVERLTAPRGPLAAGSGSPVAEGAAFPPAPAPPPPDTDEPMFGEMRA